MVLFRLVNVESLRKLFRILEYDPSLNDGAMIEGDGDFIEGSVRLDATVGEIRSGCSNWSSLESRDVGRVD